MNDLQNDDLWSQMEKDEDEGTFEEVAIDDQKTNRRGAGL